ncbi:MAG: UDP-N-acetylmuramate--L-alanine ligase [Cumulibacter sp.]
MGTERVLPAYAEEGRLFDVADLGSVHFIGIGGVGMSGIARIMLELGVTVSGSDAKASKVLEDLRAAGAGIHLGQRAENIGDADTVVVSSAIKPQNPELAAALSSGRRVLPRAQALSSVMRGRKPIAVAGTHGKTSTTSMLVAALVGCGVDPSYAVGAELNATGRNAHLGSGEAFAVEADESDGSFLLFAPHIGVVTNIEADHLDNYGDFQSVLSAFDTFVDTIDAGGALVLCADDAHAAGLAERAARRGLRVIDYGQTDAAQLRLRDIDVAAEHTTYTLTGEGVPGELEVRVAAAGEHMAMNSAAVLGVCLALELPLASAVGGLANYAGVERRMQLRGVANAVRVYDDYAHHPTEVRAQLRAARRVAGDGRIVACFQPHLFSRTAEFARQFGEALSLADEVVVMDVYPARESAADFPGVTGESISRYVSAPVRFIANRAEVAPALAAAARAGDVVLTIGAGDVTELGPQVLAELDGSTDE